MIAAEMQRKQHSMLTSSGVAVPVASCAHSSHMVKLNQEFWHGTQLSLARMPNSAFKQQLRAVACHRLVISGRE